MKDSIIVNKEFYENLKVIGSGGFGSVFEVKNLENFKHVIKFSFREHTLKHEFFILTLMNNINGQGYTKGIQFNPFLVECGNQFMTQEYSYEIKYTLRKNGFYNIDGWNEKKELYSFTLEKLNKSMKQVL